jgi:hypothetical protein
MPLDGPRTDEQLRPDLMCGSALQSEISDLLLLRREIVPDVISTLAHRLARGPQLATRT